MAMGAGRSVLALPAAARDNRPRESARVFAAKVSEAHAAKQPGYVVLPQL